MLTCVAATGCPAPEQIALYKLTEKNGNATLTWSAEMNDETESLGVDKPNECIFDGLSHMTNISSGTATVFG